MVPARAVLLACRARWLRPARRVRVDTRGSKVFKSARANKAFKRFCKFVANKGTRDLEIAAHLHYLRTRKTGKRRASERPSKTSATSLQRRW